jgi:uncharacterized metal-binding protein (TIGR02443 family)
MTKRLKKRFIAGATCPSCKQLDTLMLYFENNVEKLACVKCDYTETQTNDTVKAASKKSSGVIGVFKP